MKITVMGSGYVGTVTGVCFADLGNEVVCVDPIASKVERLSGGDPVIYEEGLKELLDLNLKAGRIRFTTNPKEGVEHGEVIFICVGTPQGDDGQADLKYVRAAAGDIGRHMQGYKLVVNKSTVPVRTSELVREAVEKAQPSPIAFDMASNPEFLREGSAVNDFRYPDRIVIGTDSERAKTLMAKLYRPFERMNRPILFTSIASAEIIKYASNTMLAARISFVNALSGLCEAVGGNIAEVAKGMGLDVRIGPRFLYAGCGYGGSCFPKDVRALVAVMEALNLDASFFRAIDEVNERQKRSLLPKLKRELPSLAGKRIALWGLAFKPHTDDTRDAPSRTIIEQLRAEGASVAAYDPVAGPHMAEEFRGRLEVKGDAYAAVEASDALIIVTEWDEFREPDLVRVKALMRQPIIVDGRNVLNAAEAKALGFRYQGVGK